MEEVTRFTLTIILTTVNLSMEKHMVKEFTHGSMEKSTMENGAKA